MKEHVIFFKCHDCKGCPLRDKCTISKVGSTITIKEEYESYKKNARDNPKSIEGTNLRVNRSIQIEDIFVVMKENIKYRIYNRYSKKK